MTGKEERFTSQGLADLEFIGHNGFLDTVSHVVMRLRNQCAAANHVSVFETVASIVPDPDYAGFITISVRPLSIVDPFEEP